MAHFKVSGSHKPRRAIIVAYYANPNFFRKKKCDAKFRLIINNLIQKYPDDTILVAGDFNRSRAETIKFLEDFNLKPATAPNNQWITRINPSGNSNSEIDFIASN
jgi:endonuclease/exonuclease/phosphatase (EEP) superfamily protein YafD